MLDEEKQGLRSVVSIILSLAPRVEVVRAPCVSSYSTTSSSPPASDPPSAPEVRVYTVGRPAE